MLHSKTSVLATTDKAQPELRLVYQDTLHCTAMFHDLQLSVSRGEPSLDFLTRATVLVEAEAAKLPNGMGLVIVLNPDAPPPGEAARTHIKTHYPLISGHLRGLLRVVEGEGFIAAAKRSAVTLIDVALRLRCPSKVSGNVVEGASWLMRQMGPAQERQYSAQDVALAVQRLRALHDATFPLAFR
jgi:hypothetical protein